MRNYKNSILVFSLSLFAMMHTAGSLVPAYAQTQAGMIKGICDAEELPGGKLTFRVPVYANESGEAEINEAVLSEFESGGQNFQLKLSYKTKAARNLLESASLAIASVDGPTVRGSSGLESTGLGTRMKISSRSALGLNLTFAQFDPIWCRISFRKFKQ